MTERGERRDEWEREKEREREGRKRGGREREEREEGEGGGREGGGGKERVGEERRLMALLYDYIESVQLHVICSSIIHVGMGRKGDRRESREGDRGVIKSYD